MNKDEQMQKLKDIIKNQDEQLIFFKEMIEVYKKSEKGIIESFNKIVEKYKELIIVYEKENFMQKMQLRIKDNYINFLRSFNWYLK